METHDEIIDVHLHAWFNEPMNALFSPHEPATLNETVFAGTLEQMDRLGIGLGVLSGPNNVTVEWCRRAPGRFIPAWFAQPDASNIEEEAARFKDAVDNQGFRALGEFIPSYFGIAINDRRLFPLYRVCQECELPVIIHTGLDGPNFHRWGAASFRVDQGNPLLLEDVVVAFPALKIVMCHMSWPFTEQAIYMLYAHSNVYMDVGVVDWILGRAGFHRLLTHVVETVGPDKILFGTDQMSRTEKIGVAVSAIRDADFLSAADKRKILSDNARKLLGIAVPAEQQPSAAGSG